MGVNALNIKDIKPFQEGLNALKIFSDQQLEMIHITLLSHEKIEMHKNDIDVVFYVLEGKAKLSIENESGILEKGSCIEVKKDLNRAWENIGKEPFNVLAIKKIFIK